MTTILKSDKMNISIYVPRLVYELPNEERVREIMDNYNIGDVNRVDFVQKRTDHGTYYSAYIHFNKIYSCGDVCSLSASTQTGHVCGTTVVNAIQSQGVFRLNLSDCYWLLCLNKKPQTAKEAYIGQLFRNLKATTMQFTDQDNVNILEELAMIDKNVAMYGDMWRTAVVEDMWEDDIILKKYLKQCDKEGIDAFVPITLYCDQCNKYEECVEDPISPGEWYCKPCWRGNVPELPNRAMVL